MTIEEVRAILEQKMTDGRLTLPPDALGSKNIEGLLHTYFDGEPIEITDAEIETQNGRVLVTGKADVFAQTNIPVETQFFLSGGKTHIGMHVPLPEAWKFADSFPFTGDLNLAELTFSGGSFVFDSSKDVTKQLSFEGDLQDAGITQDVLKLLGKDTWRMSGNIRLEEELPRIVLSSAAQTFKIGFLELPLVLSFETGVFKKPDGSFASLFSSFGLASIIQFNAKNKTIEMPVSTRFNRYLGARTFRAELEQVSLAALSELSALLDGVDLIKSLPKEFRPDKNLALTALEFTIIPRTKELASISLGVKTTQSWQLFENFSIESVGVEFTVANPAKKNARQLMCTISGVFDFGDGQKLAVAAGLPGFDVIGYLPEGATLKLHTLLQRFLPQAQGIPEATLNELEFEIQPKAKALSLRAGLADEWKIGSGKSQVVIRNLSLALEHSSTSTSAMVSGGASIGDLAIDMSANIAETFVWSARLKGLTIKTVAQQFFPGEITLPDKIPDIRFDPIELSLTPQTGAFSISGRSNSPWALPVGVNGVSLSDVNFQITRSGGKGAQKKTTGAIGGKLNIGSASFALQYNFPGEFIFAGKLPEINLSQLLQEFCGGDLIRDLPVPANVLSAHLSDVVFTIAPKSKTLSISAKSDLGQAEINIKKIGTKWGFSVAFVPPANWKFSSLAPELSVLDGLKFSNSALVLASADDRALAVKSISAPVRVTKGFNFVASLSLTGLGADKILNIKALQVNAAIGGNPANMVLEASIEGSVEIDENTAFGDIRLQIQPSPTNFSLTLLGTVFAKIGDSNLLFIGGMEVQPRSATFEATMLGDWKEPFGAKGVVVSDVALELGMSFFPPLPKLGFAGTLQVGEFKGSIAVKFDSAMPTRSMLAIAFNRLYLMDVIKQFCGPTIASGIPQSVQKTVLDIGFEDVSIYIVPQPTSIGELKYEKGFTVQGRMRFWGLYAFAYLSIDYTSGVLVKADVDEINIGGIFKLTGAKGREKASLLFDLRRGKTPTVDIQGAVELLGLRSETVLKISDKGFYFFTQGKIFDLFEATIEAQGSDLKNGGDFMISVSMRQDLFEYLREKATAAIDAAAKEAIREISNAQRDLDRVQVEVNRLLGEINRMRAVIRAERARDAKRLQDARRAVQGEQNKVNSLNNQIASMRRTVQAERDRDTKRIQDARRKVQAAQNEVNRLQNDINWSHNRIAALKRAIQAKEAWYNRLAWYDKLNPAKWGSVVAENTPRVAEISGLGIKIGALETAKHTAWGVLEAAKAVLRGIEAGAKTFPIDADIRVAGLIAAHGTAWLALEAAKGVLQGLEAAAKTFPIDADIRIAGLFTAYGGATAGLEVANGILEATKLAVGGLADVGKFIVDVGLGGLIDIKSASFYASLAAANGGRVSMSIELLFMKKDRHTLALDFSFSDPLSAVNSLVKSLMPA